MDLRGRQGKGKENIIKALFWYIPFTLYSHLTVGGDEPGGDGEPVVDDESGFERGCVGGSVVYEFDVDDSTGVCELDKAGDV